MPAVIQLGVMLSLGSSTGPLSEYRCEVSMEIYITWGQVKPGQWGEYERLFLTASAAAEAMAGPVARWLLRDLDEPDAGFAVSLWESAQALEEFKASPTVQHIRAQKSSDVFVRQYERHHCEVRVSSPAALHRISPLDSRGSMHVTEASPPRATEPP